MFLAAPALLRPTRLLTALGLLFCGAYSAHAATAETAPRLNQTTIIFAGSKNYPPFEWLDEQGQPKGFLIDLENALARSGKTGIVHRQMAWHKALQALESGEVDVVPMFVTPARKERFVFTEPFYHLTHAIFTRQGNPAASGPDDLRDKRVAVVASSYAHEQLQVRQQSGELTLTLIESRDIGGALRKVDNRQAGYAIVASHTARRLISDYALAIDQTSPPMWPRSYAFAVRQDNVELQQWLQHHLVLIQVSGEYQKIYARWDDQLEWSNPGLADFLKQYSWILTALLTAVILISIWSWLLRKQVRRRTRQLSQELERRKQAESELEYQAHHDALTGLSNRQHFINELEKLRHDHATRELTVAAIQINGIDEVILNFGYNVGEDMLRAFAERLRSARLTILGHLGTGQYAVARTGNMPPARLAECIRETLQLDYMEIDPRISIGIIESRSGDNNAEELLRKANVALAAAIKRHRPWQQYQANIEPDRKAISLLRDYWQQGTDNFRPYYQPQFDLQNNHIIGAEVLVRWHHPSHGLLKPDSFIPILEKSGVIYRLTEKMIDDAVRFTARHRREESPCPVSVNVAASDLLEHDLATTIRRSLDTHGGDSQDLRLEMTETGLITEPARVRWILEDLQQMGIQCSIDDFGTGYSSLSYLSEFPVSGIKIERMFVGNMNEEKRLQSIVSSTINLAHDLDMHVVAEGPEDTATLDSLRKYGCDFAQGHVYATALPEQDFLQFVDNWSGRRH